MNEPLGATLAAVNATLNGTAALLLLGGWLMASAFAVSTVFLICYLTRVAV